MRTWQASSSSSIYCDRVAPDVKPVSCGRKSLTFLERRTAMAERDEFSAFLIGFIIGGLTGAAISLLMAPQSGEETREILKDRAIELRDKAQETAQVARE